MLLGTTYTKDCRRNLSGKVTRSGDSITVFMAEPGDHEFDGVFELLFIGENSEPEGTWKSNSGIISPKEFKLKRIETSKSRNWEEEEEISMENLHQFFADAYDTIG